MGSPISPIVANIYMEDVENKVLNKATRSDMWMIHGSRSSTRRSMLSKNISSVDRNIKYTYLPFLHCDVHINEDRSLHFTGNPHTDQYLLFDFHHLLEDKLGVISVQSCLG